MHYRAIARFARFVYIINMTTSRCIRQGITFEIGDQREGWIETHDCTVRALKVVTGVPYSDAHAKMETLGRESRKGMNVPMLDVMTQMSHVYGYVVTPFDVHGDNSRVRLGDVVRRCRTGRYYVVITGHALAIVNGVVHDQGISGAGCQVKAVYKFTPSSEVEAAQ
jgi:hypothetical protein